ncbi:MAG: amidohydrolase [Sphingobacteriales bacterium]|nr:MAG: amidohydrolase [Sphingobacteriales bacterium]
MKIDAHNHFWNFDAVKHSWIDGTMTAIQQSFLPEEFGKILNENGIDGCVAVQVEQNLEENNFLLALADENPFIKAVVGWVDLTAKDLDEQLEQLSHHKKLKGFRHIAQAEANDFLATPAIINGVSKLAAHNFTFDILVFPTQLPAAIELVKACPNQKFVLDHLAKPYIKKGEIQQWKKDITQLSAFENVSCKISGMVTEANWQNWKNDDFYPYLDIAFEGFGTNRLLFGSDWPVCLLAAEYHQVKNILETYINTLSANQQNQFWGGNAIDFYHITT